MGWTIGGTDLGSKTHGEFILVHQMERPRGGIEKRSELKIQTWNINLGILHLLWF